MKIRQQKGFTLIELLVTVVIISVLAAFSIPTYYSYISRADRASLIADSRSVYRGFIMYYMEDPDGTGGYPFQASAPAFNLTTFYPLTARTAGLANDGANYIDILSLASLKKRIVNEIADSYDSPDIVPNDNATFYITYRLAKDPEVRVIVAQTDADILDQDGNVLVTGQYLDGIFLYLRGVLQYL